MDQEIPLWLAGVIVTGLIILMTLHHVWRGRHSWRNRHRDNHNDKE